MTKKQFILLLQMLKLILIAAAGASWSIYDYTKGADELIAEAKDS